MAVDGSYGRDRTMQRESHVRIWPQRRKLIAVAFLRGDRPFAVAFCFPNS